MTQAFNLALLANNVNSAGKLNAAAGLYNATPVANGGTGNTSAGTAGQALVSNGTIFSPTAIVNSVNGLTGAVTGIGSFNGVQVFTANGTFTIPAGITKVRVTVVGGGGGGSIGGGGGGGTATKFISGLTPGGTVSVTVGTGGSGAGWLTSAGSGTTSSFGAYCSATGGTGGFTGAGGSTFSSGGVGLPAM